MLGDIVKVDFLKKEVLGVVLSHREYEYQNSYCIVARSTLEATDENIEILRNTQMEKLFNLETSSRFGNDLKKVGEHKENELLKTKTLEYQNQYRPLRAIEMVKLSKKETENMDDLQLYVFLDIANEKGVYNVLSSLIAK